MSVQSRRGANAERAVAKLFGGRRVGNRGKATADVVCEGWLVLEVKERQELPRWQKRALAQAEAAAAAFRSPKFPGVILHEHGARRVDDMLLCRVGEFRSWFGGVPAEPGQPDDDDPLPY